MVILNLNASRHKHLVSPTSDDDLIPCLTLPVLPHHVAQVPNTLPRSPTTLLWSPTTLPWSLSILVWCKSRAQ